MPEIRKLTGHGNSTVHKYIKGVVILPAYARILREKQGGSKQRAKKRWMAAKLQAQKALGNLSRRDYLLILAALYWGEGTKHELNVINGDPILLRTILKCLYSIGVEKRDVRINIRVYGVQNLSKTKKFWLNFLNLSSDQYVGHEILDGNKTGKLKYGMCRIRVRKAGNFFKFIMSMIDLIGRTTPS